MSKKLIWKRHGLWFRPDNKLAWMQSHAMLPTPLHLGGETYRIFFGSRNSKNQSYIGSILVDLEQDAKITQVEKQPVLAPGRLGTFDDNGVVPSCALRVNGKIYLYYIGFKPGGTTRMDLFGGLAIAEDENSQFQRVSEAPILDRTSRNPFINTAPWVVQPNGNAFYVYYVSGVEWLTPDLPRYNIQIGKSLDGSNIIRDGTVAVDFKDGENALARPFVMKDTDGYKMWFSAKGDQYSLKYAESLDGIRWERQDNTHQFSDPIDGIDDQMECYAVVIRSRNKYFMFYNGNGYGHDGICLATTE